MPEIKTPVGIDAGTLAALSHGPRGADALKNLSKEQVRDKKEVEKAANGFEALLLQQMMKSMWETVDSTGLLGENSNEAQIYRDMLNQAVADNTAKGKGIGVKKVLIKELNAKAKHHKVTAEPTSDE